MGEQVARWHPALAGLAALLVACIPEPLTGPADGAVPTSDTAPAVDGPGSGADGAGDDATTDSPGQGGDGIAPSDAGSDVPPVPDGSIRCGETATLCDLSTTECCDAVYGHVGDAGAVFDLNQPQCVATGAGTCGNSTITGATFSYEFVQSCMAGAGCPSGAVCCAEVSDAGGFESVDRIMCRPQSTCATLGRTLCVNKGDCVAPQGCQPETDPLLSNIYPRYCQ